MGDDHGGGILEMPLELLLQRVELVPPDQPLVEQSLAQVVHEAPQQPPTFVPRPVNVHDRTRSDVYQADAFIQGDAPDHAGARDELRSRARALLPALDGADLLRAHVGIRPIPPDGLPVVGRLDGVEGMYAVVTHSAAHLGPLLGRLSAEELAGTPSPLLETFRPQRFDDTVAAAVEDESFHETRIALANHVAHDSGRAG